MTKKDVAQIIDVYISYYVATTTILFSFVNDPHLVDLLNRKGMDRGSMTRFGKRDDTYTKNYDVYGAIENVRNNKQYNLEMLGGLLMTIISVIGDKLKQNDYFEKTSELEFFRHIRNAISHGNQFYFKHNEPKRQAMFKNFEITASLQGKNCLFEFMSTGDVIELLEYTKNYLLK